MAELKLRSVTKRYGETVAVDAIDLTVAGGTYCCLLGPSGCGKTSSLRMIAGHETITEGVISIDGDPVNGLPPARRGTAMMFQSYALFPHLNVRDNVAFSLRMRGIDKAKRHARAGELLDLVHMADFAERMPAQLSGGQQQRVALARALITNPQVLLLDEPLSALDPYLRVLMREELRKLQTDLGLTFVHVTHSQEEALALADRVVVMDQGRIAQAGTPRELFHHPRSAFVARFIGGHNVLPASLIGAGEGSIAIRHDGIRFAAGGAGEHGLEARVRLIEYQGSTVQVRLEAGDQPLLAVLGERDFAAAAIEIGQTVSLAWSKDEVRRLV